MKIALIQSLCAENPDASLERHRDLVARAADGGAQVVCLQELCLWPYFCQSQSPEAFAFAQDPAGPVVEAFSKMAARHNLWLIVPLFEKRAPGLYHNTAVVLDASGQTRGLYRKMHIPDDPGFEEKYYFTPGDLGYPVFETPHGRVGVLICWDQWFPEAARLCALGGADVIFYPTAIGALTGETQEQARDQHQAWLIAQRAHAVANGIFVAACNRTGREHGIRFWGGSFVADPMGRFVAQASADNEEVLLADCDLTQVETTRQTWPFLRDRRIDSYDGLLFRYGADA